MKTTSSARRIVRMRITLGGLMLLVIVGIELGLGASMVSRAGQTTTNQTEVPRVSISDLMIAAR
jgi:hypothetical protein